MQDGSYNDLLASQPVAAFGAFHLLPYQKLLLEQGKPVRMGSRAFDILSALVERAGEIISKSELEAVAWPDTFVEESSLRVHIAALRKILGQGDQSRFIVNVSGRGYCFTAPVEKLNWSAPFEQTASQPVRRSLPAPLTRLIGRDQALKAIIEQAAHRRLLTITGAGGIGKTTVAVAVADQLSSRHQDGIAFVDLAPTGDGAVLASAIASVIGVALAGSDPVASLVNQLRSRRMLLVLDNCEHLLDATAPLVEALLAGAPEVSVITTSREPLRVAGEWVHRLAPLSFPAEDADLAGDEARRYSAVELFIERATATTDSLELDDRALAVVSRICRELDGLPLAIEIAAAQAGSFSIDELAKRLESSSILDVRGARTARSRHQSLTALLDWSYNLLSADEQTVIRRLSVFRGSFSQDAATVVAADSRLSRSDALALVMDLSAKSLLAADVSGDQVHYRLPVVTRVYAANKLAETSEVRDVQKRHAAFFRDALAEAQRLWGQVSPSDWLLRYRGMVDDARAGLDWAFASSGDQRIGLELMTGFTTLGFRLWLIDELKERVSFTLRTYPFDSSPAPNIEARLCIAFAGLTNMTSGSSQVVAANYARALDIATRIGVPAMQVEALAGSFAWAYGVADYRSCENYGQQLAMIASGLNDPAIAFIADRCLAQARSGLGDHGRAITLAERVLNSPVKTVPTSYMLFPIAIDVSMRIVQARAHWVLGMTDRAVDLAKRAIDASFGDAAYSPCQAWALAAIPIAIWRGDYDVARGMNDEMRAHARKLALGWWERWTERFDEILAIKQADSLRPIGPGVSTEAGPMVDEFMGALDARFAGPELLLRVDAGHAAWCAPEILRSKALQAAAAGEDDATVDALLDRAMAMAQRQGALSWELRIAISQADRLTQQQPNSDAAPLLRPLLARFVEGRETLDFRRASQMIERSGV